MMTSGIHPSIHPLGRVLLTFKPKSQRSVMVLMEKWRTIFGKYESFNHNVLLLCGEAITAAFTARGHRQSIKILPLIICYRICRGGDNLTRIFGFSVAASLLTLRNEKASEQAKNVGDGDWSFESVGWSETHLKAVPLLPFLTYPLMTVSRKHSLPLSDSSSS